ncbi:hypothetical protein SDC9_13696 [bioreactor metagenome]|uniref:Uncharacterized protein n=1 Tax=bioreactor metagenome TaxID=1076179 RepID=A0A644TNY4_9ZZZZ|nr:hypothetical protein [Negativicutes bacterium]
MRRKKVFVTLLLMLTLFLPSQTVFAGIKVSDDGKPVFISSHMMGGDVIRQPNGNSSLNTIITGFAGNSFPLQVRFKTLTTFIATARYESPISTIVLTNDTGKETLSRYNFTMFLNRPGAMYTQVVDWKISFPTEGFYAFNIFVDGALVGYYPFYVWTNGIVIK